MRVDGGRKGLKSSRDKNDGAYSSGRGEKRLLSDHGSELRLGRREKKIVKSAEIIYGISKKGGNEFFGCSV